MPDLRKRLIRLAHEDAKLRPHLLPLLREAGGIRPSDQTGIQGLVVGMARRLPGKKNFLARGEDGVTITLDDGSRLSIVPIRTPKGVTGFTTETGKGGSRRFLFPDGVSFGGRRMRNWMAPSPSGPEFRLPAKVITEAVQQTTSDIIAFINRSL